MAGAFQTNAFQDNAFQTADAGAPSAAAGLVGGAWYSKKTYNTFVRRLSDLYPEREEPENELLLEAARLAREAEEAEEAEEDDERTILLLS